MTFDFSSIDEIEELTKPKAKGLFDFSTLDFPKELINKEKKKVNPILKVGFKLPITHNVKLICERKSVFDSITEQMHRSNIKLIESIIDKDNILKKDFDTMYLYEFKTNSNSLVLIFKDNIDDEINCQITVNFEYNYTRKVIITLNDKEYYNAVHDCIKTVNDEQF